MSVKVVIYSTNVRRNSNILYECQAKDECLRRNTVEGLMVFNECESNDAWYITNFRLRMLLHNEYQATVEYYTLTFSQNMNDLYRMSVERRMIYIECQSNDE